MSNKHLKKCSIFFVSRKMQIKMAMRFHLIYVRMAKIKNTSNSSCWQRCGAKGTFFPLMVGMQTYTTFWKSVWCFLRKRGIDRPQGSAIPLLGICPRRRTILSQGKLLNYLQSNFIHNGSKPATM